MGGPVRRRRREASLRAIYIKKLHSASGVIKPPVEYDWIQLDYTGRIMVDGDVFVTRDSAVAVEQGTFEYFTHYVPQMIQFYEDGDLPRGVYDAVGTMNEGDRVRVYVPYTLAYGNYGRSFTGGYQGRYRAFRSRRLSSWIWS